MNADLRATNKAKADHATGGRPIFELRRSSRWHFELVTHTIDSPDKSQSLCIFREKSIWSKNLRYYLVTEKKGPKILELLSDRSEWFSSVRTSDVEIVFPNAVDGGKPVELNYTDEPFQGDRGKMTYGNLTLADKVVAVIGKQINWVRDVKCHITVAQGCDMFIPTLLAWAICCKVLLRLQPRSHGRGGDVASSYYDDDLLDGAVVPTDCGWTA